MATSTQRIIVMIVMLQLVVIIVSGFWNGVTNARTQQEVGYYNTNGSSWVTNMMTNVPNSTPDSGQTIIYDKSAGNVIAGQLGIMSLLLNGIGGIWKSYGGCFANECDTAVGWWVYSILQFLMITLATLTVYEVVVFIWSKKYS